MFKNFDIDIVWIREGEKYQGKKDVTDFENTNYLTMLTSVNLQ